MSPNRVLPPLLCGLLSAFVLTGCEPAGDPPPVQVQVFVHPGAIDNAGQTATVSVNVNQGIGVAATGEVTLSAPAGSFNGGGASVSVSLDGASKASATYACNAATIEGCAGQIRIAADWQGNLGYVTVAVGDPSDEEEVPDGVDLDLSLTASVDKVYLRSDERAVLTATATDLAADGAPLVDEQITFTTDVGFVGVNLATATTQSVTVSSNAEGVASVILVEDGTSGVAKVTATARKSTAQASVSFVDLASVTHLALDASQETLYLGQGAHSVLTATVVDTENGSTPLAGQEVIFRTTAGYLGVDAATATRRELTRVTDADGVATAVLVEGSTAGVASVSIEARQATTATSVNFVDLATITTVAVTAAEDTLYLRTGASTVVTTTVMDTSDGSTPVAGEEVTFTTTAGFVGLDAATATTRSVTVLTDAQGIAAAVLVDGGTAGVAQISAEARRAMGQTSVNFVDLTSITQVSLATSTPRLYLGLGASSKLTATVTDTSNGSRPLVGEPVTFTTSVGYVGTDAASAVDQSITVVTNEAGVATAYLVEDGLAGDAQVRAEARQTSSQATVAFLEVATIAHTGTKCGGNNCTVMGIRGSGFNENANVTFNVKDAQGRAAIGVKVAFSITNAPAQTTVSPTGTTDNAGNVTANIVAGPTTGVFAVSAVVIDGLVATTSDSIGIRGAKPSNLGFSLDCAQRNIATFANDPISTPRPYTVRCTVKVVDRLNNPVGTGTSVSLSTEAGAIPASTVTKAYSPTGSNADEGVGTFDFSSVGGRYPPEDVTPLAADPGQLPRPRLAEPFGNDFALVRNPRDGLVTIMASVRGEEYFADSNNNGTWDPGEQFIDQGEPFVDFNDNGVWDEGEFYVDQAPANGKWDGPNGVWDSDTTIWTETRILFTGYPDTRWSMGTPGSGMFAELCGTGGGLAKGASTPVGATFLDLNLNRLHVDANFTATKTQGSKGSVTLDSVNDQDAFGFTWGRLKVRPDDGATCTASDPVCHWRIVFENWTQPSILASVQGAPTSDSRDCENAVVRLRGTLFGTSLDLNFTGGIE